MSPISFSRMKSLWRNLLHKEQADGELDAEIRAYVDQVTAEKIAAGVVPAEARRQALVEFGGVEQVKEEVRGVRAGALLDQFWQDVRYGVRVLGKNPGFTLVAVLTLALGIGVNASIFTLFDSVALRPLQLPESNRLLDVYQTMHGKMNRNVMGGVNLSSYPEYLEYRDHNQVFSSLAAYKPETRVTLASTREEITGQLATCNYFDVVQVKPALGRGFVASECAEANASAVVVLSHNLWENTFHSDPEILGKVIRMNRVPLTVIGVMPPSFRGTQIIPAEFWAPITMAPTIVKLSFRPLLTDDDSSWLAMLGRLNDGATVAQARANLSVIAAQIDQKRPGRKTEVNVNTATLFGRPDMRVVVFSAGSVVLVAVGLVLLIACANIANLMLARAAGRTREIAVRLAMGASRARLVRQLLTESLLIAFAGGAFGLLVSTWTEPALVKTLLARIPSGGPWFSVSGTPDLRVIAYAAALTIVTGMAFGLAPALQATRNDVNEALKDEGTQTTQQSRGRLRGALVGIQVAVCMVLLICAGLLLRGLAHAQQIDPGFEMNHIGMVNYRLQTQGFTAEQAAAFNREMRDRVIGVQGVEEIAEVAAAPLANVHFGGQFSEPGHSERRGMTYNVVGANFFSLLGIPLTRGRSFTETEVRNNLPVIVVNEAAARVWWPGQDPIGKRLQAFRRTHETYEVVGVAKDVELDQVGEAHEPFIFLPVTPADQADIMLLVRTRSPFDEVAAPIRDAARRADAELKIEVISLRTNLEDWPLGPARILVVLAGTLGLLGLVLASIGIYGTTAYTVSRRVREIGIRMALGARAQDVKALVLRQSMRPVLIGGAAGILLCAAVTRILSKLLFGVSPLDGIAFVSVGAFLIAVALLASYLPARRAVRVDPMVALRHE
jgi:macrolide transport system ATP-binding/permease protein